jgi:hypothetical protein
MMIFFALMIALGVIFGTGAVVIDGGYGMAQQTVMQNAADAGALAGAKLMANQVTTGSNNTVIYMVKDRDVFNQASTFASSNYSRSTDGATYSLAVRYQACPPSGSGTPPVYFPMFSALTSDSSVLNIANSEGLVAEAQKQGLLTTSPPPTAAQILQKLRFSSPDALGIGTVGTVPWDGWPSSVCSVRVYSETNYNSILAGVIGQQTGFVTANATARIFPTAPPSFESANFWPITHQITSNPSTLPEACVYPAQCTFWDGKGQFKEDVDFSKNSFEPPNDEQLFKCSAEPCWDQNRIGNHTLTDLQYWLENPFRGHLSISMDPLNPSKFNPNCTDSDKDFVLENCPNSRLETFKLTNTGDKGQNIACEIEGPQSDSQTCKNNPDLTPNYKGYIPTNGDPNNLDPTCQCKFVTLPVFLWQHGEVWQQQGQNVGSWKTWDEKNGSPDRIIIREARLFRFLAEQANNSSVTGYYVAYYIANGTSYDGPPTAVANTVKLSA